MLRQTIMIITNVLVSVSLSRTKNATYFFVPSFCLTEILLININKHKICQTDWAGDRDTKRPFPNTWDILYNILVTICEFSPRQDNVWRVVLIISILVSPALTHAPDCWWHAELPRRKLAPGDMWAWGDGWSRAVGGEETWPRSLTAGGESCWDEFSETFVETKDW